MSNHYATADRVALVAAAYDFADSTAAVVYQSGKPAHVRRAVIVITEASAGTSTVTVVKRDRTNDTNSKTIGSFVVAAGAAVNKIVYANIGNNTTQALQADGTYVYDSGKSEIKLMPWEELVFTSDGLGTAGIGDLYVEYSEGGQELVDQIKAVWTGVVY